MALFKRNETGRSVAEALSLRGDATPTPLPAGGGREEVKELPLVGKNAYGSPNPPVCLRRVNLPAGGVYLSMYEWKINEMEKKICYTQNKEC